MCFSYVHSSPPPFFLSSDSKHVSRFGQMPVPEILEVQNSPAEQTVCHAHTRTHSHTSLLLHPSSCWILFLVFWEKLGLTFKRECSGLCQQGLVLVIQPQLVGTNSQSYMLHHALQVLSRLTFPCHLKQKVLLGLDKVIIWTSLKVLLLQNQRGQCSAALQRLELDNMTTSWSWCVPFLP